MTQGYAFERTHPRSDDFDWLPGGWQVLRYALVGGSWTVMVGGLLALSHWDPTTATIALTSGFSGGWYAGGRVARALMRRKVARLAHGQADLSRLKQEADGELVRVQGHVRASRALPGILGDAGVYRRLHFNVANTWMVHEAGVDFSIVDDSGELALVHASGARLIASEPKMRTVDRATESAVKSLPLPANVIGRLRRRTGWGTKMRAGETLLRDGDRVTIVGYKSRVVDATVERMERETPMRAVLRRGKELPLLLIVE